MRNTLVGLLRHWAEKKPNSIAMREKKFGIWKAITWKTFYDQVSDFSNGLYNLGMRPGETLAVIGDNAPEWVIAELAAMRLGGSCVGIFPDMLVEEVVYLLNSTASRIVVVKDQEQVDKLVEVWDQICENVSRVIVWDSRGMSHYFNRHHFLTHFKEVLTLEPPGKREGVFNEITIKPEQTALMLPTSGTTGLPKLAITSHDNLIQAAQTWQEVHPYYEWDELFSLLPLPWMGEQFTLSRFLSASCRYNFAESPSSVKGDYRECQPTLFTASPRMYEDICSDIRARMEDASFLKKLLYNYSLRLGIEHAETLLNGEQELGFIKKRLYSFFLSTTLRSLRQRVGLARIRLAATGGAAIGREVFVFYMALGINLMQLYGMTENCATATCHYPKDIRPETVGKPLPSMQVKVDDDGMIYVKGPTNTIGYFNNPEETSLAIKDGWFKTGDAGYFDEYGHLVVLDRQKDLMFLNDGTRFAPQELENRLKFSPYIREAVVFGNKRDIITAMLSIDMENVGNWANKRNVAYTTFMDLSLNHQIIDLIRDEIKRINNRLPQGMRLRRFVLLPKELHPDDEELTRTRKIKRRVINERYKSLIEALYQVNKTHDLDIQIRYMDGTVSQLKSTLSLEDV
ncbi:MAG: AMP-binding protein [Desulfatiglans sp.]|jgi:long-chain acyl-CoA synthetase|nr:AMP-binding protein [Thermodesulfobacteriota bacterium]MEE4353153.1 AMP-binding protein [Desulfatiglans sp.]